jgi:hypothetical protein
MHGKGVNQHLIIYSLLSMTQLVWIYESREIKKKEKKVRNIENKKFDFDVY